MLQRVYWLRLFAQCDYGISGRCHRNVFLSKAIKQGATNTAADGIVAHLVTDKRPVAAQATRGQILCVVSRVIFRTWNAF